MPLIQGIKEVVLVMGDGRKMTFTHDHIQARTSQEFVMIIVPAEDRQIKKLEVRGR